MPTNVLVACGSLLLPRKMWKDSHEAIHYLFGTLLLFLIIMRPLADPCGYAWISAKV